MYNRVKDHGYTFCKYKLIDFFQVVMLTISFVCVIDITLNVGYSEFEANRLRQRGGLKGVESHNCWKIKK